MNDEYRTDIQFENGDLKVSPILVLKGIIEDNYPPGTFIKEIIQNADDAGAKSLHLGLHPGWPNANNPLLRSPLILALNDGEFRQKDRGAINLLYAGAKADDNEKIGKYGLGLKSVFNLSECAFILASAGYEATGTRPFFMTLSPWGNTIKPERAQWTKHDKESGELLFSMINRWQNTLKRWFCVIAPLRTRELVKGIDPICQSYPVPGEIFNDSLSSDVALMLPMLAHIEQVVIWSWVNNLPEKSKEIMIDATSEKRYQLDKLEPAKTHFIHGCVITKNKTGISNTLIYAGCELILSEELVAPLRKDESWPTINVLDSAGEPITKPVDARPHAASVFVRPSTNLIKGSLEVVDSVFLPLWGDQLCESLEGNNDYRLILHGCYFVDKGRRALTITAKNADKTTNSKNAWNLTLKRYGVYPNILPALSLFADRFNLSHHEIAGLTRGLRDLLAKGSFKSENISECLKKGWIWCLDLDRKEKGKWEIFEPDQRFLELPPYTNNSTFENNISGLISTLPALREIARNVSITVNDVPRINCSAPSPWKEQPEILTKLLESIKVESLRDQKSLEFLFLFLGLVNSEKESLDYRIDQIIVGFMCRLLPQLSDHEILEPSYGLKQLLIAIGKDRFVKLVSLDKNIQIWRKLCKNKLSVLPIPSCLTQVLMGGQLSCADFKTIIDELEVVKMDPVVRSEISYDVLKNTKLTSTLSELLNEKSIFAIQGVDGQIVAASWRQINNAFENKLLFAGGPGGLLPSLRSAVKHASVSFIPVMDSNLNLDPFEILFKLKIPPKLGGNECLEILSKMPELNEPSKRVSLLLNLKGNADDSRKPLRYLLHGDASAFEDNSLMFYENNDIKPIVARVCRLTFTRVHAEWRMVPRVLTEKLTEHEMRLLGLGPLTVKHLEILLGDDQQNEWLAGIGFSSDERFQLIEEFQKNGTENYWKKLPLHELFGRARLSAIDSDQTFVCKSLNPQYPLLASTALLVKPPIPETWNRLYRNLEEWDSAPALKVAMRKENPSIYWTEILDAISDLHGHEEEIQDHLKVQLEESAWLPGIGNKRYKPHEIIYLEGLESELADLLKGIFPVVQDIEPLVLNHPAFRWVLNNLLLSETDILNVIGMGLSDKSNYCLGRIRECILEPSIGIKGFVRTFAGIDSRLMPVLPILERILSTGSQNKFGEPEARQLIEPIIEKDPPSAVIRKYLNHLQKAHERGNEKEKSVSLVFFKIYLRLLLDQEPWPFTGAKDFELLSRAGIWKPAAILSRSGSLIDDDLLDKGIESMLYLNKPNIEQTPMDVPRNSLSPLDLKNYFEPWTKCYPQVGCLLSLLGGTPDAANLAQYFFDSSNRMKVETIRSELDLTQKAVGGGFTTRIALDIRERRFECRIANTSDEIIIRSLVGTSFTAHLATSFKHLFVQSEFNINSAFLDFRRVDPRVLPEPELNRLLKESAVKILLEIYRQPENAIEHIWSLLENSEQFQIEVTQHRLVDQIDANLRPLGVLRIPGLRNLIAELQDAETQSIQHSIMAGNDLNLGRRGNIPQHMLDSATSEKELIMIQDKIKKVLEADEEVQAQILKAIRYRMTTDNQYFYSSVPFELFQNADDAANELSGMLENCDLPTNLDRIDFKGDDHCLVFIHWGRGINECRRGKFAPEEGIKRGYHRDLEKMLLLHYSDKTGECPGINDVRVTGKFGLGFKSVFLVTKCPRIRSGKLSFDIVGGFYPRNLSADNDQKLFQYSGNSLEATIIELPIDDSTNLNLDTVLEKFSKLAPISLAFSRQIKRFHFVNLDKEIIWRDNTVFECQGIFVGKLNWIDDGSPKIALVIRQSSDIGAFLIGLDHRGFTRLPEDVPSIWFTEPTESEHLGFAFNGPFVLSMGRRRLPNDIEQNKQTAQIIGLEIGQRLVSLANLLVDSNISSRVLADLHVDCEIDRYDFWYSLWKIVGQEFPKVPSPEKELIIAALWSEGMGFRNMYYNSPTLPSELHGKYRVTTKISNVNYIICGILDQNSDAFTQISSWDSFNLLGKPGEFVSDMRVREPLKNLGIISFEKTLEITLTKMIDEEISKTRYKITLDQAERFGSILNQLAGNFYESPEYTQLLVPLMSKIMFETNSRDIRGNCLARPARDLVCFGFDSDEDRQAAFAPADRVLNNCYTGNLNAIKFFARCRRQKNTSLETLAEWAINADTNRRKAVLEYILSGESAKSLANHLAAAKAGSWLADLTTDSLSIKELRSPDQIIVLLELGSPFSEINQQKLPFVITEPTLVINPHKTLCDIYEWWHDEKTIRVNKYNSEIYEQGILPKVSPEPVDISESQWREEWLKLFLISILQTMGMTKREQNREFVSLCSRQGLLSNIFESNAWVDDVATRFEKLDSDLNSYYRWFEKIIGLHLLSLHLDDYALLYSDQINRLQRISLNELTMPRLSAELQQGGANLPPIRSIMGRGMNFMLRELTRRDIISNHLVDPYCYVGFRRVRNLLQNYLGFKVPIDPHDQPMMIYQFLYDQMGKKALFDNCFDIPLEIVSEDANLIRKFFGEESTLGIGQEDMEDE